MQVSPELLIHPSRQKTPHAVQGKREGKNAVLFQPPSNPSPSFRRPIIPCHATCKEDLHPKTQCHPSMPCNALPVAIPSQFQKRIMQPTTQLKRPMRPPFPMICRRRHRCCCCSCFCFDLPFSRQTRCTTLLGVESENTPLRKTRRHKKV